MIEHNVDIKLAEAPIAHRFAAWAITRRLRFTYRKMLSALTDCRIIRICPCGDPECASMYLSPPDPNLLSLPKGGTYWNTTAGLIGLSIKDEFIDLEGYKLRSDDQHFPHRAEIHHALHKGHSPTKNMHAREARQVFRQWVAKLEDREFVRIEVET